MIILGAECDALMIAASTTTYLLFPFLFTNIPLSFSSWYCFGESGIVMRAECRGVFQKYTKSTASGVSSLFCAVPSSTYFNTKTFSS